MIVNTKRDKRTEPACAVSRFSPLTALVEGTFCPATARTACVTTISSGFLTFVATVADDDSASRRIPVLRVSDVRGGW